MEVAFLLESFLGQVEHPLGVACPFSFKATGRGDVRVITSSTSCALVAQLLQPKEWVTHETGARDCISPLSRYLAYTGLAA